MFLVKVFYLILQMCGIVYDHLAYFVAIWYTYFVLFWYIIPRFGLLYLEKPEAHS
jgi:hypothetical protein